jgi:hypothetical protein
VTTTKKKEMGFSGEERETDKFSLMWHPPDSEKDWEFRQCHQLVPQASQLCLCIPANHTKTYELNQ